MKERWALCMEGYAVSDRGRVRALDTGRELRAMRKPNGYLYVSDTRSGKRANHYVHRLVAGAFCPNPDGKRYVNHLDGDKANNRAENLEWATNGENARHAYATGLNAVTDAQRERSRAYMRSLPPEVREKAMRNRRAWWDGLTRDEQRRRMSAAGRAAAEKRRAKA